MQFQSGLDLNHFGCAGAVGPMTGDVKTPGKRHRESRLHHERRDLCQLVGT